MASLKPTQAPAFDAKGFCKRLYERVTQTNGTPYAVFGENGMPRWARWINGTGEFDGKGLRDVINTNAIYLDDVKNDLDAHKTVDNARHTSLAQRVAALEGQNTNAPFPGSG